MSPWDLHLKRQAQKREAIEKVKCPKCGAGAGFLCVGPSGNVHHHAHRERYFEAGVLVKRKAKR